MGFDDKIKEQVLVESARHCSVCHKYKGLNVEVHHIKPKAEGGPDTYDNAIALCLDCHLAAGHYNPNHPKGTKFSYSELKKHKKAWIEIVKNKGIKPARESYVHCRYYIAKRFDVLTELFKSQKHYEPFENAFFLRNEISEYFDLMFEGHKLKNREDEHYGDWYNPEFDYSKKFPDAKKYNKKHSYMEYVRSPLIEELQKRFITDGITKQLVESNYDPIEMAVVEAYIDECGGGLLQDIFILRKAWPIFFVIENTSQQSILLDEIELEGALNEGFDIYPLEHKAKTKHSTELPQTKLNHGEKIFLLIGIILPGNKHKHDTIYRASQEAPSDQSQWLKYQIDYKNISEFKWFGNFLLPQKINIQIDDESYGEEIHQLDFSKTYGINRYWECGSCPFLIFVNKKNEMLMAKEIFNIDNQTITETIKIPNEASQAHIVEVCSETTFINYVKLNGSTVLENKVLVQNEHISISDLSPGVIEINGIYKLCYNKRLYKNSIRTKESLIENYMAKMCMK